MITVQPYTYEDLFRDLPNLGNGILLDLGCGSQRGFTRTYISYLYKRLAADTNPTAMAEASRRPENNTIAVDLEHKLLEALPLGKSVCSDARCLPFSDAFFDIVAMGWLLDRLKGKQEIYKVMRESSRVLKERGYLIGDVALHPIRSVHERLGGAELSFDLPSYYRQMVFYRNILPKFGFNILSSGMGFNSEQIDEYHTFYFVAQKVT
ncbi:class I SAM-dependent methyltransferase [Candidatus Woesearchaeota archaeon]|nr:class I SAM-dependent methyltransferase [Candidatus Woesearchaeota archaeon]